MPPKPPKPAHSAPSPAITETPPLHPPSRASKPSSNNEEITKETRSDESTTLTSDSPPPPPSPPPPLLHTVANEKSILALVVAGGKIFAGTQGGRILVWSLETFELLTDIVAHKGAVLGLFISAQGNLLFSSAGDAIVNVWCTAEFKRVYSIYSTYDVGDVFCVVHSASLQTIYLGAQNTSIQWYDFSRTDAQVRPDLSSHPSQRNHRFFDSKGPGGLCTPRPVEANGYFDHGGQVLEICTENIIQYAHYGYVYCMLLAKGLIQHDSGEEVLISGGGDGTIKLWQLSQSSEGPIKELATLEAGDNSVLTLALDGTLLYSGRLEGDVNVWDLDTRQLIQTVKAYSADVLTIAVGHGLIFTGGADAYAKIFERYKLKKQWKAHSQLILASVVSSYNGSPILVTGGNDNLVAIWDISELVNQPLRQVTASNERLLESLSRFISFRTVSCQREYAEECRRGASWLRGLFRQFGAQTQMLNTDGNSNPVIFARFKGKPTAAKEGKKILFYGHYDVVAAANEQKKWTTNPFSLQGRDGYLYGRGVSDNKGPVLAALYAVAELVAEQKLETDVVFLIEGEEECGSRGFEEAVKRNKHIIGTIDWILLANSYWLNDDYPCLTYGLRGVIHANISVESIHPDLHSGVNGSHLMDEALKDLVTLLSKLNGINGHVGIPGFADDILPITTAENMLYDAISETLLRDNSEPADKKHSTASLKAKWREPSLTIHGFKTSGQSNSTIIPHAASAEISLRLVPNQDALEIQKALIEYLERQFAILGTSNKLSVTTGHPVDPWLGDPENEIYQTLEEAIIEVWGLQDRASTESDRNPLPKTLKSPSSKSQKSTEKKGRIQRKGQNSRSPENNKHAAGEDIPEFSYRRLQKPLYIREGGSIPALRFLEKEFDAPAAQLPCGQASDSAHLDNERLRLSNLYKGREIFKKVFQELPMR